MTTGNIRPTWLAALAEKLQVFSDLLPRLTDDGRREFADYLRLYVSPPASEMENLLLAGLLAQSCLQRKQVAHLTYIVQRTHLRAPKRAELDGKSRGVSAARRHIEQYFAEPLRIEQIATVSGLSPSQLATEFRRNYGMGIGEFISEKRVRYAIHLLATTDWKVEAVGSVAGFGSRATFYRAIREWSGLSPSQLRARLKVLQSHLTKEMQAPSKKAGRR